jgi:hypothetical protein
MEFRRHGGWLISMALLMLVGCAGRDYRTLPVEEQQLYRAYSQVMTGAQSKQYLALSRASDRQAYAKEIGVAQRLEALSPQEQEAVRGGVVFNGMSAEALEFVWGTPCRREGPKTDERWYYEGPAFALPEVGWNCSSSDATFVEARLSDGKLDWWKERIRTRPGIRRRP